jgi:hypothetical protein
VVSPVRSTAKPGLIVIEVTGGTARTYMTVTFCGLLPTPEAVTGTVAVCVPGFSPALDG